MVAYNDDGMDVLVLMPVTKLEITYLMMLMEAVEVVVVHDESKVDEVEDKALQRNDSDDDDDDLNRLKPLLD